MDKSNEKSNEKWNTSAIKALAEKYGLTAENRSKYARGLTLLEEANNQQG